MKKRMLDGNTKISLRPRNPIESDTLHQTVLTPTKTSRIITLCARARSKESCLSNRPSQNVISIPRTLLEGVLMIISASYGFAWEAFDDAETIITDHQVDELGIEHVCIHLEKRMGFERNISYDEAGLRYERRGRISVLVAELEAEAERRTRHVKFRSWDGTMQCMLIGGKSWHMASTRTMDEVRCWVPKWTDWICSDAGILSYGSQRHKQIDNTTTR